VQPLAIVEDLDELEQLCLGLLARAIVLVMDQFVLQRTEEALHHRVVVTSPLPTRAGHEPVSREQGLVGASACGRP